MPGYGSIVSSTDAPSAVQDGGPSSGAADSVPRSRRCRTKRALLAVGIVVAALALGVTLAAGSRAVNRFLDGRAIATMAAAARRAPARAPGASQAPLPWTTASELEALTRPPPGALAVAVGPLTRFRMDDPTLVQEVITFPSAIPLDHPESNVARAYVYRHGRLGERPVVLWVPGQYVIDLALTPISWFTTEIVRRGADVVLFVPPYHLERTPAGMSSGDAVFATSLSDHLNVYAQELSDLRRLARWLRRRGVPALGGFGGSVGGLLLLRIVTWDDAFDFLTAFIPALSLGDVLEQPEARPFRERLAAEGHAVAEMARIYAALDPTFAKPRLDPARISALYGRYDRIAGERRILDWARAWGVTRLFGYPRGHALALFNTRMYADYARILDEDLRAFGR